MDPENLDALSYKGGPLHELGKYDEAIKCFDIASEIDPKDVASWINKGIVLKDLEGIVLKDLYIDGDTFK